MAGDPANRVVLGMDGARFADALAVVATDVITGFQWPVGIWERPEGADDAYEHPFDLIDGAIEEVFADYDVWRMYVDPQYVEDWVNIWIGRYGPKRVIEWRTNRPRQIAHSVRGFSEAIGAANTSFAGTDAFIRHLKNARRQKVNVYDDQHRQMHTIAKDRPDSPRKMDAAMAAVLSWEARGDCIAAGETAKKAFRHGGFR
jgi:hypothetical protein